MNFVDRVSATPLVFMLGCVVFIPAAVWTLSMVHWMVNGDIEAVYGVPAILVVLALAMVTIKPPDPVVSPFAFLGIVGAVVVYPALRKALEGRAHAHIDLELISGAYDLLDAKPDNIGPRIRMAEVVAARGMYAAAVRLVEPCVPLMTLPAFGGELKELAGWKAMAHGPNAYDAVTCPSCGVKNDPGELYCRRCQGRVVLDHARISWLGPTISHRLVSAWVVGTLAVVGIPAVAHSGWPTAVVVALVVTMMAGGIYSLVRVFGEPMA